MFPQVSARATADISDLQIFLDAEMVLTGGSGLQLTDFQVSLIILHTLPDNTVS